MSQTEKKPAFIQPTATSVRQRIRAQRKLRRMTLHDVEKLSGGRIKAVVMGSYERGTRAISLSRTIEIANLFGIPVTELITEAAATSEPKFQGLIFDLRKVSEAEHRQRENFDIQSLSRYLKSIAIRRHDWNGEVLSLRLGDCENLSLITGRRPDELLDLWQREGLVLTTPIHL